MCQTAQRKMFPLWGTIEKLNLLYIIMSLLTKKAIWVEFDLEQLFSPSSGNIRNTEKLSYDRQQQYEIQVTAWDCGQKRALHSVPVRIDVKPVCKPGWQGGPLSYLFVCVCLCARRTECVIFKHSETQMQLFVCDYLSLGSMCVSAWLYCTVCAQQWSVE